MRPCKDWRKNTYLQFSGQGHSSDVYGLRVVAVTRIISSLKTKKMWWDEMTQDEHLLIPKEKHSNSEFVFLPPSLPEQFERSCVWWWPSSRPLPPHLWLSPRSTPRPAWLWWILWWANDKSPCPENQRQEGLKINWVSTDNKNTNNCEGLSFFFICVHIIMILTTQKVTSHYLFRECFVWPEHWVSLRILIQHLSIGPVVLNLRK